MTENTTLAALPREAAGTGPARALRREGRVPAILYGGDREPAMLSVEDRRLRWLIGRGGFSNTLFDLQIEGGGSERVIPKEVQLHPVTDRPLHVDFMRVSATSEVQLRVPVALLNQEDCAGLKAGGVLAIASYDVELVCRADSIPEALEADLGPLEIGDAIRLSDLALPEGVRAVAEGEDPLIASIGAPQGGMDEDEAEEEGGEDGEEPAAEEEAGEG